MFILYILQKKAIRGNIAPSAYCCPFQPECEEIRCDDPSEVPLRQIAVHPDTDVVCVRYSKVLKSFYSKELYI